MADAVNVILGEIEPGKRLDGDTWLKNILTTDWTDDVVQKRASTDMAMDAEYSTGGPSPSAVCNDGTYAYALLTSGNGIRTLDLDLNLISSLTTFNGGDTFSSPAGICCDNNGNIYVGDTYNNRIVKFTSAAGVLAYDSEIAVTNQPAQIDTDNTNIFVMRQLVWTLEKRLCSDLSLVTSTSTTLLGARDICNDGTYLYLPRSANDIQKRNISDLALVSSFGSTGAGDNNFDDPYGIATDGDYLYIGDRANDRIKQHEKDGTYVAEASDNITLISGVDIMSLYSIAHAKTPSRVTENGVELTSRATYALCAANASSWYYDSANSRLYVHTTGSDDPGGGSYIIMSYFWEYIATHAGEYNGYWYYGRLNKENIPSIESSVSGPHEGVVTLSPGSISINNLPIQPATAGFYDSRLSTYVYEGAKIILLRGEQDAAYGTFEAFIHGYLGDWECDEKHFIPQIDDFRKYL